MTPEEREKKAAERAQKAAETAQRISEFGKTKLNDLFGKAKKAVDDAFGLDDLDNKPTWDSGSLMNIPPKQPKDIVPKNVVPEEATPPVSPSQPAKKKSTRHQF